MTPRSSQMTMPFERRVSYAAEDFIIGESNRQAAEVLDRFPDWPEPVMAIFGPTGSGKTHLAHRLATHHNGVVLAADALGKTDAATLAAQAPLLVVDGWQDEAALAQLINYCRAEKHALLITTREAPSRCAVKLPDLHSRLSAVVALEMFAPDEALLTALLVKHFADRQIRVAPDVIQYMVSRMERSYEAALHAAAWLDARALEAGRAITLPLAKEWIEHAQQ